MRPHESAKTLRERLLAFTVMQVNQPDQFVSIFSKLVSGQDVSLSRLAEENSLAAHENSECQ